MSGWASRLRRSIASRSLLKSLTLNNEAAGCFYAIVQPEDPSEPEWTVNQMSSGSEWLRMLGPKASDGNAHKF